ncbi:hypothetical protein Leryth_014333 [Lithospermum erythrorhizon]|nr:hypothetical protein Leryth_014333 [Lithospermum erythrorhizon]
MYLCMMLNDDHANLRLFAAELLLIAQDVEGIPSPKLKIAAFLYKAGVLFHDLRNFENASSCFEKATDLISKIEVNLVVDIDEQKLLLDLNIARSRTAWESSDRNLAVILLNRSKNVLFGSGERCRVLANQYLSFGKELLSNNEVSGVNEALKLFNEALELSEKGLRIVKRTDETLALKELRSKVLRFIGALHLQRDEFDSVLKCVKVLRECGGDKHPSLSVLSMKAWLGLGKYVEAEKELRGMVVDKGVPEAVWVSAVESYFQAAGAAGAETAKEVFLGLLGRCHVSAGSTIRLVNRVIGEGGGGEATKVRAKVVAELVSDERVVDLFAGEGPAKERSAMHALLWTCGAQHFRSKDYETSALLFEKSMLYVPANIESRILRAKGYRSLCLCYLALLQLDRAREYIDEAEKLEPNITCSFLKFKIYLQGNELDRAVAQVQAMSSCLDFTPNFLSLAAHEAVSCRAISVSISALTSLLNFYSSGKPMPTTEVVVFRTLVSILTQNPGYDSDILKCLKRAHARLSELGPDRYFGKGEVGKREWNWFALNTWNLGIQTGKQQMYELSAEFFRLASEFYGVDVDNEAERNTIMTCKSLILSVSALIADEKQKNGKLLETEAKQAIDLLDRAGKILMSSTWSSQNDDFQNSATEPNFLFIYTWSAYDLYSRFSEMAPQQLALVKYYASSKSCDPQLLLQIGLDASQGPLINPEVATFALNTCLSSFLSSPSPDFKKVALVIRKLISIATIYKGDADEDAVIVLYKHAYRIMVGLREGEYPTEEAKWLAMTAWNRAAIPKRLGQIEAARNWMNIGLDMAKKVPGMQTYQSCMEDQVNSFQSKFTGHEDSQSQSLIIIS